MGSRVLRVIARGYSLDRRHLQPIRFLYSLASSSSSSAAAATLYSSSNSAVSYRTPQPKLWSPSPANTRFFSASPGSSKVVIVNSDAEFSNALSKAQDNKGLAVAYFTAAWCGPCRTIFPIVESLSTSYSNVTFLKLDIDQENLSKTVTNSGVASVPTFHFYKNGAMVADLIGADPNRLKEIVGNLSN